MPPAFDELTSQTLPKTVHNVSDVFHDSKYGITEPTGYAGRV
jgi:hypothetical protein